MAWIDMRATTMFLLSALVHELGHLAALRFCRLQVYSIRLCAFGAVIKTQVSDYKKEILCALSGPLAGVLLCLLVLRQFPKLAMISLALSIVNLLPLRPLDGGRIANGVLMLFFEPVLAEKILYIISFITCSCLMILACWATVCLQAGLWPIFASLAILCRIGNMENSCFSEAGRIK